MLRDIGLGRRARWRRRRRYHASPGAHAAVRVILSDAHVEFEIGDLVKSSVTWPIFTKLLRASDGLLLYASLPKTC